MLSGYHQRNSVQLKQSFVGIWGHKMHNFENLFGIDHEKRVTEQSEKFIHGPRQTHCESKNYDEYIAGQYLVG